MTTNAPQTTPGGTDRAPLTLAVTWALAQAGTGVLADSAQLKALLAQAPVAESPERTVLARNLDDGFLAAFDKVVAANAMPDARALAGAAEAAKRHLVEACFIDEAIAQAAAIQFADGIAEAARTGGDSSGGGAPSFSVSLVEPAAEPATPSSPVGMKTYAPATGDHDALAARVGAATAFLGRRKVRTIAFAACALALAIYLLFSIVAPSKARLTFHGNGATGGVMMSITADQDSLVELPLCGFRREGYEFVGWYNENTHELLLAQSLVTAHGRVSYMAEWAPVVQFDTGGSNPAALEPITVTRGDTIELPKASFSKPPYEFLGWSVEGQEDSWNEPGQTVAISGPTTFVATWGYKITFRGNGATEGSVEPIKSLEGAKVLLPENGYTFADHKFSGWAQDVFETKPAKPGEEVTVGCSLVFNAIWRSKVSFDGNGATGGTTKAFFAKTSGRLTLPECGFEREGYHFVGWSMTKPPEEAAEDAGAQDTTAATDATDADESAAAELELHNPGEKLTIAQPTTFYACWELVEEEA